MYLLVYVDDIINTGNTPCAIQSLLSKLASTFAMKDLGDHHFFLGIQVQRQLESLYLRQRQYILDVLQRAAMLDAKPVPTPMVVSSKLSQSEGDPLPDPSSTNRSIVSSLQYITITRPDMAFVVNKVSQFVATPTSTHWHAVKHIVRCLKGTFSHGLCLRPSSFQLQAYSDVD